MTNIVLWGHPSMKHHQVPIPTCLGNRLGQPLVPPRWGHHVLVRSRAVGRILWVWECCVMMKEHEQTLESLESPHLPCQWVQRTLRGRRRLETAPGREVVPRRHLRAHIRLLAQMANGSEIVRMKQELGTGFEVMSVHDALVGAREGGWWEEFQVIALDNVWVSLMEPETVPA